MHRIPIALVGIATLACGGLGAQPSSPTAPKIHPDHPDALVPHVHGSELGTLEVAVGSGGRDVNARMIHWATHRFVPELHACLEPTWRSEPEARGGGSLTLPLDADGRVTGLEDTAAKGDQADCFGEVLLGARLPRRPNQLEARAHLKLRWHPTKGVPLEPLDVPLPRTKQRPMSLEDWWESLDRVLVPVDPDAVRQATASRQAKPQAPYVDRSAPTEPPLQLSTTRGNAPLEVHFTGPEELVALGEGAWNGWGGCSYTVDWGDGSTGPEPRTKDCGEDQRHRYTMPGTYTVVATRFELGPTDAPETTWWSEVDVVVTGTAAGTDTVTLGDAPEAALPYGSPIPVKVQADPKGESELTVDVFAEGERVLFHLQAVKGPFDRTLHIRTDRSGPLDRALARDVTTFDVEVALVRDGRRVGQTARQTVKLTGEIPPNGVVVQAYEASPGEVWLEASKGALDGHRWWVDWGDGTTEAGGVSRLSSSRQSPPMAPLRHRYEAPGTYDVQFRYDVYPGAGAPVTVAVTGP